MKRPAERLKYIIDERGLSMRGVSKSAGLGDETARLIIEGKSANPGINTLEKLAKALSINVQWLALGEGEISANDSLIEIEPIIPPPETNELLPVLGVARGGENDFTQVNGVPTEWVTRPAYLKNVKEAYAVQVIGDSMTPYAPPGVTVLVNPKQMPIVGHGVVVQVEYPTGEVAGYVKILERRTSDLLYLRQYNPSEVIVIEQKYVKSIQYICQVNFSR